MAEYVRSFLAVVVVIVSLAVIVAAYAYRGIGDAERLASIFGASLGFVLGYYFGREGVDRAEGHAEKATMEKLDIQKRTEKFDEFRSRVEASKELAREYVRIMKLLEEEYPEVARKVNEAGEAMDE